MVSIRGTHCLLLPAVLIHSELHAGGVPLVLYNKQLDSLVISPLRLEQFFTVPCTVLDRFARSNYMVGVQTLSKRNNGVLCAGFGGKVQILPTGWTHQTIFYAGKGASCYPSFVCLAWLA